MEFNKTIAARQSVRKFTEAQITDDQCGIPEGSG